MDFVLINDLNNNYNEINNYICDINYIPDIIKNIHHLISCKSNQPLIKNQHTNIITNIHINSNQAFF